MRGNVMDEAESSKVVAAAFVQRRSAWDMALDRPPHIDRFNPGVRLIEVSFLIVIAVTLTHVFCRRPLRIRGCRSVEDT